MCHWWCPRQECLAVSGTKWINRQTYNVYDAQAQWSTQTNVMLGETSSDMWTKDSEKSSNPENVTV